MLDMGAGILAQAFERSEGTGPRVQLSMLPDRGSGGRAENALIWEDDAAKSERAMAIFGMDCAGISRVLNYCRPLNGASDGRKLHKGTPKVAGSRFLMASGREGFVDLQMDRAEPARSDAPRRKPEMRASIKEECVGGGRPIPIRHFLDEEVLAYCKSLDEPQMRKFLCADECCAVGNHGETGNAQVAQSLGQICTVSQDL